MSDHEKSKAHVSCSEELRIRSARVIEEACKKANTVWNEQHSTRIQNTARMFRTVYLIAWKHLSFRVSSHLVNLQQQNGVDMGSMLFSHQSCSNILRFVASKMSSRLTQFIINSDAPFSILMGESTTISNKTALIIYIRIVDPSGEYSVVLDWCLFC